MATILIKNGRVWDGDRFIYSDILTSADKIAKIEPNIRETADFTYDAAGKTVSAGLVDAHIHMRGVSSETFGIHGEMACFPFGVTAAADAGAFRGDKALLDSFMLKSVVFVPVTIKENHVDFTIVERKLAEYGDKAIGLKVYFSASANVLDCTPLGETCSFAQARNLSVMVHCTNQPVPMAQLLDELKPGDILTHAFHGERNTSAEDGFESLRSAQMRGVIIDAGFAGHIHTDFGVFGQAVRQGILPDTISTDITTRSAYTRGGRYGLTTCMTMARVAGMQEEDIFRAVTTSPAKALGKQDEWGILAVGRTADIAVLDHTDEGFSLTDATGNHMESKTGYRCVLTIADGQIVYKH